MAQLAHRATLGCFHEDAMPARCLDGGVESTRVLQMGRSREEKIWLSHISCEGSQLDQSRVLTTTAPTLRLCKSTIFSRLVSSFSLDILHHIIFYIMFVSWTRPPNTPAPAAPHSASARRVRAAPGSSRALRTRAAGTPCWRTRCAVSRRYSAGPRAGGHAAAAPGP